MLSNTVKLVEAAREKGVLILHCPITFTDDYKEIAETDFGILANVKAGQAFKASGWGGAICDSLTPVAGDVTIHGKRGLCGFASTNLDFVLRHNKIENVVIGGFLTNCCVESTMRSAYEKGYRVFTLTDCTAATSVEEQDAAVKFTYPMFSKPVTSTDFLSLLA